MPSRRERGPEGRPSDIDLVKLAPHLRTAGGRQLDRRRVARLLAAWAGPLVEATKHTPLVAGLTAEQVFLAVVAELGVVTLIKSEDCGEMWSADDTLQRPDYVIALRDGGRFLVEVKHFYQGPKAMRKHSMTRSYIGRLRAYGEAVGLDVKVAVYWSRWNLWTLVPLDLYVRGPSRSVTLETAMRFSEMASVGDVLLATCFPLRARIRADAALLRAVHNGRPIRRRSAPGGARFEISCAGRRLQTESECRLALWLMANGGWREESEFGVDGRGAWLDLIYTPEEDPGRQMAMLGPVSSIITTDHTRGGGGPLEALKIEIHGGVISRLLPADYRSEALPLWRFRVAPASE